MVSIEAFKMTLAAVVPKGGETRVAIALHPKDYFELEAQALRNKTEHPFTVAQGMGIHLYVTEKAPRMGT